MTRHPIVRRMGILSDQWAAFRAHETARVLCWRLTAMEEPMFGAFLELESDQSTAEHPDVFVTFAVPFESAADYGLRLMTKLVEGCAEGSDELHELGLATGWRLPPRDKKEADVAYALRSCESFAKFYQLSGHLVLVLRPSELTDVAAHHDWLAEFAKLAPAGVRAVLLDSVEEPVHAALDARDPARIVVQRALLDMPEALIEVSEAAGHLDTPGGQFRDLFVRMSGAIAKNDIAAALPLAAAAVAVAQANRLWYLAVPVHIAIATTLLGAKRGLEAIAQYVAAEVAAQRGVDDSESGSDGLCQRLLLEARISHGTALIVLEKFTDAASHFELTAQLAAAEKAWLVAFDARRLVSFCWERAGDETRAWQTGLVALRSARLIDPSERATSTLPHLGEALSRLAKSDRKPSAQAVARELAELLDGQHFMAADGGASTSAAHA